MKNKTLTGTAVYVKIFQCTSLLPLLYIFTVSGYPALLTKRSALSFLFDIGYSALPRAVSLPVSLLYRATASEMLIYFIPLLLALILGITAGKLLHKGGKSARAFQIVLLVLIAADLLLRALPFSFNAAFGTLPAVLGALVRVATAIMIYLDLRKEKKAEKSHC